MSFKRALGLGLVGLALLVGAIVYVRASERFGDCNSLDYLRLFDARLAEGLGALGRDEFLCVVPLEVPVDTPDGEKRIRVIRHVVSDWAEGPGVGAAVERGVRASAAALPRLGDFRIGNATVLLLDGFGPGGRHENFGEIAAWTNPGPNGECLITLWLLGPAARAERAGAVIAHELMHCVQFASLSAGQMGSAAPGGASGGGTWWMEGSADWFSTVALPAAPFIAGRVRRFDADSPRVALNLMTYDAFVFFAWHGGARGVESVMPFLRGMAEGSSAFAQQAAMRNVLPAAGWLQFAEDYLDRNIRDGQGASIGSTPEDGETWTFTDTRTERIALEPFVLQRGNVVFECGRWGARATPAEHHAAKPTEGRWGPFPATVDALDGTVRRFRFAAMATASRRVDLQLNATREVSCQECAGTREIDQCLVGTWEMTSSGMAELVNPWMRGQARVTHVAPNTTMVLNADRTFSSTTSGGTSAIAGRHGNAHGVISGQGSGRWSAAGGVLNACADVNDHAGTVTGCGAGKCSTKEIRATTVRNPMRNAYECSATTLRLRVEIGRAGTFHNVFRRASPPPDAP
jgi:hypothetical protein